jgi:polysaccharide deacetylase 2 family uncharacterized protein YibQ
MTVPHVKGINNHMGSKATRAPILMEFLMKEIKVRGFYFIDSRTHHETVALRRAIEKGVPAAERSVFLDNENDPDFIRKRIALLRQRAREEGYAIGIGHLRSSTIESLRAELPHFSEYGVEIKLPSELLVLMHRRQIIR